MAARGAAGGRRRGGAGERRRRRRGGRAGVDGAHARRVIAPPRSGVFVPGHDEGQTRGEGEGGAGGRGGGDCMNPRKRRARAGATRRGAAGCGGWDSLASRRSA